MGVGIPLRPAGEPAPLGSSWRTGAPADDTLVEVARAAVAGTAAPDGGGAGGWEAAFDDFWCTVRPPEALAHPGLLPARGWKIHISAAGTVATEVLSAVAGVLAEDPCVFRFAADRERLHRINARAGDHGPACGFITVHPMDEAQFLRLLEELHLATEGLPGPAVPGTRPFAPNSRVHYRYGAVAGQRSEDVRGTGHRCPPPVADPVEGRGPATGGGAGGGRQDAGSVLVGDRYALTAAVRSGGRSRVYLGTDTSTGVPVLVKQARSRIGVDRTGAGARPALRREARLLGELAGQGLTARPLELIEQADSLLLVQEHLPGQPLGSWVAARLSPGSAPGVPWEQAGPMALALTDLLTRVHAHGLVLRDLSPDSVLVAPTPRGPQLRLADLERACPAGTVAGPAGAPGYRAPEQGAVGGRPPGSGESRPAEPAADLFALGGLLFLLATGHDPLLPEDLPRFRPVPERLGRWLALAARESDTARRLAPAVLGLRAEPPGRRWTLDQLRELLTRTRATPSAGAPAAPPPEQVDRVLDRVLLDGLRRLAISATPRRPDQLWPAVPGGQHADPCGVRRDTAGVLAVLARALRQPGLLPAEPRSAVELTVRQAARWVERHCAAAPLALPGPPFARSGAIWALLDAAEALGDPALGERARRLAAPVPWQRPGPARCHGAAGAGFLRLRLGDTEAALGIARELLAAAEQEACGTLRPVPKDVDADLDHVPGVAGVGAFLLAVHRATGDAAALAGAERAARTLAATACLAGAAARWPQRAGEPPGVRLAHGCGGASHAGGFLVRLWQHTGDPALREPAVAAGLALLDGHRHGGTGACRALADDGEYLLDLARATGEPRFRAGARELAQLITARATLQDGLLVLSDGTGTGCPPTHGTGSAGPLAFLLRLRHGGPRLWLDLPTDPVAAVPRPTGRFEEVSP
ncbi:class IV lanthionine synthetase LanL [Kitasatospora sp. NBC_01250]|uniref:class IV lanthionine synthetase LanL n=1 Tax=Kitasatospora sp. NBC_01250 TaxID=2903571 RepID=UPI002E349585|nr:class IV lanthionine synthetase LanL [Kitasatospora sp. NBC_01250]